MSAGTAPARPRWPRCWRARPCPPPARCGGPAQSATCRRTRAPATLNVLAMDRVLSSRGLDELLARDARGRGADGRDRPGQARRRRAQVRSPGRAADRPRRLRRAGRGGLARRQPGPARTGCSASRCAPCPAASAGGWNWPGSCSAGAETLLLDEPTNHLDADSVGWLRDHLRAFRGGLVVISHDVSLLDAVVNKVFYLDAQRCALDQYSLGWRAYLAQRETDQARRKRERATNERKAAALQAQADKMRAKATKATAAKVMAAPGRAAAVRTARRAAGRQGGQAAVSRAGAVRAHPADRDRAVEVVRLARGLLRRGPGRGRGQQGGGARPERRGQDHPAAAAGRDRHPGRRARSGPATGSGSAITHRSTRRSTSSRTVLENMRSAAPGADRVRAAAHPRLVPVPRRRRGASRPASCPAARRPGSRWPFS